MKADLWVALPLAALVAAACGSAAAGSPAAPGLRTDACLGVPASAGTPAVQGAAYSQNGGTASRSDQAISASASNQPAVLVTGSGRLSLTNVSVLTLGANSPGVYSAGVVDVTGSKLTAVCSVAAVVEGPNAIQVVDSSLSGEKNGGVMIYSGSSGDAPRAPGTYTQTGGSLRAIEGPLFHVTNTSAVVGLAGVELSTRSGTLLEAAAGSWGTSGANGGSVTLNVSRQSMAGAVVADRLSSAVLNLAEGSELSGAIDAAGTAKDVTLVMDGTSRWIVTADSHLGELDDASGFSGGSVLNIVGGGHSVYYRAVSNPQLGGRTYALAGGGTLAPE